MRIARRERQDAGRHREATRHPRSSYCRILFGALLLGALTCRADLVTDGTVGPVARLAGPEIVIGDDLGSVRGANLFHSFRTFDIRAGQRATFTGPDQIQNVIGRVTGGKPSRIDGSLSSKVGKAAVFLVNPSGVVMGPNATVDVPGAFHLSTADEIRFGDGGVYSATAPAGSSLSMATPESFGFLAPQPASLRIEGSQIALQSGQTATLTAGDIALVGTGADTPATLSAPGGTLRIEAVGAAGGRVALASPAATPGTGKLTVAQARIATSGDGGGQLRVRAGTAELSDALLEANNESDLAATGGIEIAVSESLTLRAGTDINTNPLAAGDAGSITVKAATLHLLDGATLGSHSNSAAAAGTITVNAGNLRLEGAGTGISSGSWSTDADAGAAGAVLIQAAGLIELLHGAAIGSGSLTGNAGDVSVQAGTLRLAGVNTGMTSGAWGDGELGSGDTGTVTVRVAGHLELADGATLGTDTLIGQAGEVRVEAGTARLADHGASLYSGAWSVGGTDDPGHAGAVTVKIAGALELFEALIYNGSMVSGDAGPVSIEAGALRLRGGSQIMSQAESGSRGASGEVRLAVAGRLELLDASVISSSTFGQGKAGNLALQAGELLLDGSPGGSGALIASDADLGSSGDAGQIEVRVNGTMTLRDGLISSSTKGSGQAGDIVVIAHDLLMGGDGVSELIASQSLRSLDDTWEATGDAGNVRVEIAGLLELLDGAAISTTAFAQGDAGTVTIRANALRIHAGDAGIFSNAEPEATGQVGAIDILAERIAIGRGGQISIAALQTRADAQTAAGLLRIAADTLSLDGGIVTTESVGNTPASAIRIHADELSLTGNSRIATDAQAAHAGNIAIDGRLLRLDDSIVTTSVLKTGGNGGDIALDFKQLILDGGFIQANTAASGARGGDILIDTRALIASQGQLQIGGSTRQIFASGSGINVIQAAAPGGERGTIAVTAPSLDIAASLMPLSAPFADSDALIADACRTASGPRASSLVARGNGGLPADPGAPGSVSLTGARLDAVLSNRTD